MKYKFQVSCAKENLKDIRTFVGNSLKSLSVEGTQTDLIVLAVDEICANVIIHSNECDAQKALELDIMNENDAIVINIKDRGNKFDPKQIVDYSIQELTEMKRKGGLGLKLVNRIIDKIDYHFDDPYNICTLYKKVNVGIAV